MHVLTIICDDNWMSENFSEGWRRCGATVTEFLYSKNMGRGYFDTHTNLQVKASNQKMLEIARQLQTQRKLNLIFMSIYDDFLLEETLIELRKLDIPLVNYHPDMVVQWYRMLKIGKYFDFIGCAQKAHIQVFKQKYFKAQYLPFASNPVVNDTKDSLSSFDGVTFMGAPIGYRPWVLSHLYFNGIPLRIFGHHWDWVVRQPKIDEQEIIIQANGISIRSFKLSEKNIYDIKNYLPSRIREEGLSFLTEQYYKWKDRLFPVLLDAEEFYGHLPETCIKGFYDKQKFPALVRSSAINIGFTHVSGKFGDRFEKRQIRLREFEVPMAGGFYITQHCNDLSELYEIGKHIEVWHTKEDLLEKSRYYLCNPEKRNAIALAGYLHTLQNHTWEKRFKYILSELNIS